MQGMLVLKSFPRMKRKIIDNGLISRESENQTLSRPYFSEQTQKAKLIRFKTKKSY